MICSLGIEMFDNIKVWRKNEMENKTKVKVLNENGKIEYSTYEKLRVG